MGDLAFTMMDDVYALQDVHTPTVFETFTGEDNMTQHWSGGSCYCRKEGCSKHKKEKELKPPSGLRCWRKKECSKK